MASEWSTCRLEELAAPNDGSIAIGPFGSRLKADSYVNDGVALIRGTNLGQGKSLSGQFVFITPEKASELGNANLKPGDLVFPHRGAIGEVGIVPNDGRSYALSTSLMKITLDPERADAEFFFYFFTSNAGRFELLKNASQVGTPGIATPLQSLRGCIVPNLPLEEQRAIAETLGALDDRIDNLRRTNATLEAIAAALFKSRFIDFDCVPPENMQESELGLIPKGWRVRTLGEAFEINPKRELKKGTIAPYLDMASLPTTGAVPNMPVPREFSSGTKFTNDDTLLARITPCLENGKTALVNFLEQGQVGWGSTEFIVLRPKPPLPPFFGYLLARRADFREHAIRAMSGTSGRQRVEVSQLRNFKLAIPDETAANDFAEFVEPLQEALLANEAQAVILAALRNTLLPRLISGQLREKQ
ncbi:MAG: restriction endonuclease subunit S [Pseudomonas sp.]|nr:restriction endonuclease subunit S [Pseudomonas sp.]